MNEIFLEKLSDNSSEIRHKEVFRTVIIILLWISITIFSLNTEIVQKNLLKFYIYIIGGIIVIISYKLFIPEEFKEILITADYSLHNISENNLLEDYKKDTILWINKIYKNYIFSKQFKYIFLIIGLFIFPATFVVLHFNLSNLAFFLPNIQFTSENFFIIWIIHSLGVLSFIILSYFYAKSFLIHLGTSFIFHHFTFWKFKETDNRINPLGDAIILNFFLFTLETISFFHYFTGLMLCGLIYVISPINPSKNYTQNVKKSSKFLLKLIPIMLLIIAIVRIEFYDSIIYSPSFYNIITDYIQIFAFYVVWKNFIHGKTSLDDFSFNSNIIFEKITKSYAKYIVIIIAIILPISVIISIIHSNGSIIFNLKQIIFIFYTFLLSIAILLLNFGLKIIKNRTKIIAELYFPYTREDKKTEMKFHFWETFSSPQAFIFSLPFSLMFLIWSENISLQSNDSVFFTDLGIYPYFFRIPLLLSFFILGFQFGNIIWTFYHAPHFCWHSMSLISITKNDLQNNPELLQIKYGRQQVNSIILFCFFSLMLFMYGYYYWVQAKLYNYIFNLVFISLFFLTMDLIFRKLVGNAFNEKRIEILNEE